MGRLAHECLARHRRTTLAALAKRAGTPEGNLRHCIQLHRVWPQSEIAGLSARKVPWRFILVLLPLAGRAHQLRQGADDLPAAERRLQIQQLERARKRFLRVGVQRSVGLREFERQVRQWSQGHLHLWGEETKALWLQHARRRARTGCERALAALDEMYLLVEGASAAARARQAQEGLEDVLRAIGGE